MIVLGAQIHWFNPSESQLPTSWEEWVWVTVGVAGTLFFGVRFFIQWIHSERQGESKIPVSFWWLSIIATLMSASYFVHKQQWVALLGNGPQIIPYARNLVLIYRKKKRDEAAVTTPPDVVSAP